MPSSFSRIEEFYDFANLFWISNDGHRLIPVASYRDSVRIGRWELNGAKAVEGDQDQETQQKTDDCVAKWMLHNLS